MCEQDRFELGQVVATLAAIDAVEESGQDMEAVLQRHAAGDWGDVSEFDRLQNDEALELGGRLFSIYILRAGVELWVVTDEDRCQTTLRLSDETNL